MTDTNVQEQTQADIAVHPMQSTVDKRVEQYIQVRDRLKEIDEEYDAKRKPLLDIQNLLAGWLQEFMEKSGSDGIKTKHGSCYVSTRYTASLADPDVFMKYVIENRNYDLLDRRANATAVKDFVQEKGSLPPGVNLNAMKTVGVRRPTGKSAK